jgi:hypothetical protein
MSRLIRGAGIYMLRYRASLYTIFVIYDHFPFRNDAHARLSIWRQNKKRQPVFLKQQ